MIRLGLAFLLVGAGVALAYITYLTVRLVALNPEVPWPLRIALPVGGIGMLLILAGVAWERLRPRRNPVKEIERAQP